MLGSIVVNTLEFIALIVGVFYYLRNKSIPTYYLVWFLGITFLNEIFCRYTSFVQDGFLNFLIDTPFGKNYWLVNTYSIISYLFYINYFKWYLSSKRAINILNRVSWIFLLVSVLEIVFAKGYFDRFMPISNIVGTLSVFLSIGFYYLELLNSDQILKVYKTLPFYVSVGALIFHLCTTPIFIYSTYYSYSIDPSFVSLYRQIIFGSNYVLYSIYIAGFLICYYREIPYYPKKNY